MKVDFTKFPLFTGIDRQDMVIADIRKDIADGIYRNVPGLPAHVLAEKIYRNELVELAAPHDIEISYDGMKLTL